MSLRGALVGAAIVVGCGSSSETDLFEGGSGGAAAASGGSAGSGGGGTAGTGGTSGAAGTGGAAGVGGSTPAGGAGPGGAGGTPPACNPFMCQVSPVGAPCCSAAGVCGVQLSLFPGSQCIERNQPGERDASCPDLNLGGIQALGCCRPNAECGYLDTALGLGCVDPSQLGQPNASTCSPR